MLLSILALANGCALRTPGTTFRGPLHPATRLEASLSDELRADVDELAGTIGERNLGRPGQLRAAEHFLAASLARAGYFKYSLHVAPSSNSLLRTRP